MSPSWKHAVVGTVMIVLAAAGCTLPLMTAKSDTPGTMVAATIFALQTNASGTQTAFVQEVPTSAATPPPTPSTVPSITPTPQNPLVTTLALCLTGPGKVYGVVSSIKSGTRVQLLGVGSVAGWFVIENPVYHDRCWIPASSLLLDPGVNIAALQVFNPPPTPGPKITATPTP